MEKDCNECKDKLCRACDKPFMDRNKYEKEDMRFFEHIISSFIALGLVCAIWVAIWYWWTM